MDQSNVILEVSLPGLPIVARGKVRDVYSIDDKLLIIASDRISAFDYILGSGIPEKGRILTQMSLFWFAFTQEIVANHVVTAKVEEFPAELARYAHLLEGRSMLVKKAVPFPVECVVRGFLAGSGWKEYQVTGSVSGIRLSPGLLESSKLPTPIFTPATKATSGHDENISFDKVVDLLGQQIASCLKEHSLRIYHKAADYAAGRGIIIADTKFEFGSYNDQILLIDEVLTPDSSRFWPASEYAPGRAQKSFDKQFVRDFLEEAGWSKLPPAPALPGWVVDATSRKYLEAYELLTGRKL